jgi:hypothetical protein
MQLLWFHLVPTDRCIGRAALLMSRPRPAERPTANDNA